MANSINIFGFNFPIYLNGSQYNPMLFGCFSYFLNNKIEGGG